MGILFLSFILIFDKNVFPQYREYEIKAAMIGKFTLFVNWPQKKIQKSKYFNICVLGNSPISKYLKFYYKKNALKNLLVKVVNLSDNKSFKIDSCHILFLPSSFKKNTKKLIEQIKNKPILIIGDSDKFIYSGAHICFYINEDLIRFKINYRLMKEAGFEVSYLLLNIGEVVEQ